VKRASLASAAADKLLLADGSAARGTFPERRLCGWGLFGRASGDGSRAAGSAARWVGALLNCGSKRAWPAERAEQLAAWLLEHLGQPSTDPLSDLVAAAWWWHWPEIARQLTPIQRSELTDRYLESVDRWWAEPSEGGPSDWSSLLWQLEIPLLITWRLSAVSEQPPWLPQVTTQLQQRLCQIPSELSEWCSGGASELRVRWASLLRSQWLALQLDQRKLKPAAREGLVLLADWALAWSASDGRPLLSPTGDATGAVADGAADTNGVSGGGSGEQRVGVWDSRWDRGLWRMQWELVGATAAQAELAAIRLPRSWRPNDSQVRQPKSVASLDDPPVLFDSRAACWLSGCQSRRGSGRLACDWSQGDVRLELVGGGARSLLNGLWDVQLSRQGQPLGVRPEWNEICRFTDDEVDYLELESRWERLGRLQRQLLLLRPEGLLLLADAWLADESDRWGLRGSWALTPHSRVEPAEKTRELLWHAEAAGRSTQNRRPIGAAIPLGLPEWHRSAAAGRLEIEAGRLVTEVAGDGNRLYNPVVFAIRKRLARQPLTWRQLTVADELRICSPQEAVAYRVQFGQQHWLIYRSLAALRRRTALGKHLGVEFYAARFLAEEGTFEDLLEVKSEAGR
jgi:hypothetical protein